MYKLFYISSLRLTLGDDLILVDIHEIDVSDVSSDNESISVMLIAECRDSSLGVHFSDGETTEMIEISVQVSFKDSDFSIVGGTEHHLFSIILLDQNISHV